MTSRRIASVVPAILALALATQPAAAGPCEESASYCVPGSGVVSACRAVGVLAVGQATAVGDATASITSAPAAESDRDQAVTMRRQTEFGLVEANGVLATCVAYTVGQTGAGRRGCGRADIDDLMIDLRPTLPVVITARGLVTDSCTSQGPGAGGSFAESRIEQIVLTIGGQSGPIDVKTEPNTAVPLGGGYALWVNESKPLFGGCPRNTGAALRVEGPTGSLAVGWVATGACPQA